MFSCSLEKARVLNENTSLTKKEIIEYTRVSKKGDHAEKIALNLVRQFFSVEDAWLAKTGSLLDANYKVDLVVKLKGKTKVIGIQVKSSEHGAREHEALRETRDWELGFPECLVLDQGYRMVARLEELLGIKANKRVLQALTISVKLRGRIVPIQVPGMEDLGVLGLAVACPQGYRVF